MSSLPLPNPAVSSDHAPVTPRRFLIIFGAGFLSIFALVGGILGYVFFIKTDFLSGPGIDAALSRARGDARITALLGEPISRVRGRGAVGAMSVNASVDVVLGLSGPLGEAELTAVGFQIGEQGSWEYAALELSQGEVHIDLLAGK